MSTLARKNILLAMVVTTVVVTVVGMFLGAVNMAAYIGLFGSGTKDDPYIFLESGVYDPMIEEGETLYFTYAAEGDGYICIEAEGAVITVTNHTTGTTVTAKDSVTIKVQAGDKIDIEIRYEDETQSGKVHITFAAEDDYIEGVDGAGLEKNPYVLTESGIYYPVADKGEIKYFVYTPVEDGYIYVGAEGVDIVIIDTVTGREIERTDRTTFRVTAEQTVEIRLSWTDKKAEGEMELVFITEFDFMGGTGNDGSGGVSGFGTKENPYVLTESGTYTPYVDRADTKYFVYTATGDGFVDVRIPNADIVIVNKTTGEIVKVENGVTVGVSKGDELEIRVSHPDPTTKGELVFDFTTEQDYKVGGGNVPAEPIPPRKDVITVTETGKYPSDLMAGQTQPYEYVAKGDGMIHVEAEGATVTVTNKTTGTTVILDGEGAVSVSKDDEIVIEVAWADPDREGKVDFAFTDESDYDRIPDIGTTDKKPDGITEGSGTDDDPYVIPGTGTFRPDVDKGEDVDFIYTPNADGKIEIEAEGGHIVVTDPDGNIIAEGDGKVEVDVTDGEDIRVEISHTDPDADGEIRVDFTDESDVVYDNDDTTGKGTKDDPIVIPGTGSYPTDVDKGGDKSFEYTPDEDGKVEIEVEGGHIVVTDPDGNIIAEGDGKIEVDVRDGETIDVEISHTDPEDGGELTLDFVDEGDHIYDNDDTTGKGTKDDPTVIPGTGSYPTDVDKGGDKSFEYTPNEDGRIEIEVEGGHIVVTDPDGNIIAEGDDKVIVDVKDGETVDIEISHKDPEDEGELTLDFVDEDDFVHGTPDPDGSGVAGDPYVIPGTGTYYPDPEGDGDVKYVYTPEDDGKVKIEVEGGHIIVRDHDGYVIARGDDELDVNVTAGKDIKIEISRNDPEDDGELKMDFTDESDYMAGVDGTGHEDDPYVLTESGTYPANVDKGEGKHFVYTATGEGFISVNAENAELVIINKTTGEIVVVAKGADVAVSPADEIEIILSWTDPEKSGTAELVFVNEGDYVSGADGSGSKDDPYVIPGTGSYPTDVDKGGDKNFEYTPDEDGKVKIEVEGGHIVVRDPDGNIIGKGDGKVEVDVRGGETIDVEISHTDPNGEGELTLDFVDEGDYVGQESGNGTKDDPYVLTESGSYPTDTGAGESKYFVYTATGDGFISVDAEGATVTVINKTTGAAVIVTDGVDVAVGAGDDIEIVLSWTDPEKTGTIEMGFVTEGDYLDNADGAGCEELPYVIPGTGIYYPDVPKGEDKHLQYTPTEDGKIAIDAEGATIIVTNEKTGVDYKFEDDAVIDVKAGDLVDIKVSWTEPAGDGEMEFIFTDETDYLEGIDGSGTKDDPYVLPESGTHHPEILEGETKYFNYVAREDGTLQIKAEGAVLTVINKTTGSEVTVTDSILSSVKAGDELEIRVSWEDKNKAGEVEFVFTAETDYVDPDEVAVDIVLIEQQLVDGVLIDFPDEPIHTMPGLTTSQIVKVRNDENASYVRVRWDAVIYDAEGNAMEHTHEQLEKLVLITYNTDKWVELNGDDWWYYKTPLASGEITEVLYTEFTMSGINMTNEYQGCTIKITITAQGVQADGNGNTVADAAGWRED